jgi:hypothetical protein
LREIPGAWSLNRDRGRRAFLRRWPSLEPHDARDCPTPDPIFCFLWRFPPHLLPPLGVEFHDSTASFGGFAPLREILHSWHISPTLPALIVLGCELCRPSWPSLGRRPLKPLPRFFVFYGDFRCFFARWPSLLEPIDAEDCRTSWPSLARLSDTIGSRPHHALPS